MTNTLLSPSTWSALAHEYFSPGPEPVGQHGAFWQAAELASYIAKLVEGPRRILHSATTLQYIVLWQAIDDPEPYRDLEHMSNHWDEVLAGKGSLYVSDCHHNHPVFSREDNLRFRVWHDTGHLKRQRDFTPDGEVQLFIDQANDLAGLPNGKALVEALFSESVYQLAACIHLDGFPDVQHVRTPGPVGRALLDGWGFRFPE